jgi:hypothetical protein
MTNKQIILFVLSIMILTCTVMTVSASDDTEAPEFDINIKTDGDQVNVYGDVDDVAPENVSASGVDRVELKFDVEQWTTADLSNNEYSYNYELEESGYHSVQIRAYDNAGNYDTVVKTYTASFNSDSDLELEDYVSIKSAKFTTLDSYGYISSVTEGTDIGITFDIQNDAETDIRTRVTVSSSTGFYEEEEDYSVDSGDEEEVQFWIAADVLKEGTNRFEIKIKDLATRDILDEKTMTISVETSEEESITDSTTTDSEIPAWFVAVAEENDMVFPGDDDTTELQAEIDQLNSTVAEQQDKIGKLEADISRLNNQNSNPTQSTQSNDDGQIIAGVDNIFLYIAVAGLLYWKRDKVQEILSGSSDEPSDEDHNGTSQEQQRPTPQ